MVAFIGVALLFHERDKRFLSSKVIVTLLLKSNFSNPPTFDSSALIGQSLVMHVSPNISWVEIGLKEVGWSKLVLRQRLNV